MQSPKYTSLCIKYHLVEDSFATSGVIWQKATVQEQSSKYSLVDLCRMTSQSETQDITFTCTCTLLPTNIQLWLGQSKQIWHLIGSWRAGDGAASYSRDSAWRQPVRHNPCSRRDSCAPASRSDSLLPWRRPATNSRHSQLWYNTTFSMDTLIVFQSAKLLYTQVFRYH